jgi:hypothetical protein
VEVKKNGIKNSDRMNITKDITGYYEELRSYALGYRNAFLMPLGIDLFMKKGWLAWTAAWSDYKVYRNPDTSFVQTVDEINEISIPQVIQPEFEEFERNLAILKENAHTRSEEGRKTPPREGPASFSIASVFN